MSRYINENKVSTKWKKKEAYIGNITQGKRRVKSYKVHKVEQVPEDEWITVENMHEAIIDKELFEKVKEA